MTFDEAHEPVAYRPGVEIRLTECEATLLLAALEAWQEAWRVNPACSRSVVKEFTAGLSEAVRGEPAAKKEAGNVA